MTAPRPPAAPPGQRDMPAPPRLGADRPGPAPGRRRIAEIAEPRAAVAGQRAPKGLQTAQHNAQALVGVVVQLGRLPAADAQTQVPKGMRTGRRRNPPAGGNAGLTVETVRRLHRPSTGLGPAFIRPVVKRACAKGDDPEGQDVINLLRRQKGPFGPAGLRPLAGRPRQRRRPLPRRLIPGRVPSGHAPTSRSVPCSRTGRRFPV